VQEVFHSSEIIYIPSEIIAEVVYVLQKYYQIPRYEIYNSLSDFLSNPIIAMDDLNTIIQAIKTYSESNLDYADCLVIVTAKNKKAGIFSFDKGLLNFFKKNS
jgi:predicted nucleic-acid-binding protein